MTCRVTPALAADPVGAMWGSPLDCSRSKPFLWLSGGRQCAGPARRASVGWAATCPSRAFPVLDASLPSLLLTTTSYPGVYVLTHSSGAGRALSRGPPWRYDIPPPNGATYTGDEDEAASRARVTLWLRRKYRPAAPVSPPKRPKRRGAARPSGTPPARAISPLSDEGKRPDPSSPSRLELGAPPGGKRCRGANRRRRRAKTNRDRPQGERAHGRAESCVSLDSSSAPILLEGRSRPSERLSRSS